MPVARTCRVRLEENSGVFFTIRCNSRQELPTGAVVYYVGRTCRVRLDVRSVGCGWLYHGAVANPSAVWALAPVIVAVTTAASAVRLINKRCLASQVSSRKGDGNGGGSFCNSSNRSYVVPLPTRSETGSRNDAF